MNIGAAPTRSLVLLPSLPDPTTATVAAMLSDRIIWHGRQIDLDMLVEVLSFKRNPRTLNPRSERRHHLASARQRQPELNLVVTT
jgi:hypothetical protein